MTFEQSTLARKYAMAFFIVADDSFDEHDYTAAGILLQFFIDHRNFLGLLNLPILEITNIHSLIEQLAQKFNSSHYFKRLLILLIRQRRMLIFPMILHHLRELYCEREHIIEFEIASSHSLDDEARTVLVHLLSSATGMRIRPTYRLEPKLIAGIRMQSNTLGWEHSVRKQLREIRYESM